MCDGRARRSAAQHVVPPLLRPAMTQRALLCSRVVVDCGGAIAPFPFYRARLLAGARSEPSSARGPSHRRKPSAGHSTCGRSPWSQGCDTNAAFASPGRFSPPRAGPEEIAALVVCGSPRLCILPSGRRRAGWASLQGEPPPGGGHSAWQRRRPGQAVPVKSTTSNVSRGTGCRGAMNPAVASIWSPLPRL